jgi:hypothetical protein
MAFKIQRFYGSPLNSSSPDRPFTAKDTKRKEDKLIKTSNQIDNLSDGKKKDRKMKKLAKTMDQLNRNASGDKTPLYMEGKLCKSLKIEKTRLQKEIADIKAKAAKEKKIGNWDAKSDRLSQVNEQLVKNKC